jgi:hypothetical protein
MLFYIFGLKRYLGKANKTVDGITCKKIKLISERNKERENQRRKIVVEI